SAGSRNEQAGSLCSPELWRRSEVIVAYSIRANVFPMSTIAKNLEGVRAQIAEAARKANRNVDDVELIAISKTHDASRVREAIEAGQEVFGESKVQEARAKIPELP